MALLELIESKELFPGHSYGSLLHKKINDKDFYFLAVPLSYNCVDIGEIDFIITKEQFENIEEYRKELQDFVNIHCKKEKWNDTYFFVLKNAWGTYKPYDFACNYEPLYKELLKNNIGEMINSNLWGSTMKEDLSKDFYKRYNFY